MKKIAVFALGLLMAGAFYSSAFAQQQPAKEDAKDAGRDLKDAGKATGSAAKSTGRAVKKTAKKGAHKTAGAVRKGSEKVEDKTNP